MAERSKKGRAATRISLSCGAEGAHDPTGQVVGCCYKCGLLLCATHVFHLPHGWWQQRAGQFGKVGEEKVYPLVCGTHADFFAVPGLPSTSPVAPKQRWNPLAWLRRRLPTRRRRSGPRA